MTTNASKITIISLILAISSSVFLLPLSVDAATKKAKKRYVSVSAIKGADEKNFINPTTRCLTADMKKLYASTVKQMETDIAKRGSDFVGSAQDYRAKIDIVWSAMSEPYCGYGSRGIAAVKHSFLKSVDHIRAEFNSAKAHERAILPVVLNGVEPVAEVSSSNVVTSTVSVLVTQPAPVVVPAVPAAVVAPVSEVETTPFPMGDVSLAPSSFFFLN